MANFVAKVENQTTLKKSRKSRFSDDPNAAVAPICRSVVVFLRNDVQHAPALLKIFVRHPKKTFATKTPQSRQFVAAQSFPRARRKS
jgi:hypothetical protein